MVLAMLRGCDGVTSTWPKHRPLSVSKAPPLNGVVWLAAETSAESNEKDVPTLVPAVEDTVTIINGAVDCNVLSLQEMEVLECHMVDLHNFAMGTLDSIVVDAAGTAAAGSAIVFAVRFAFSSRLDVAVRTAVGSAMCASWAVPKLAPHTVSTPPAVLGAVEMQDVANESVPVVGAQ